MRATHAEELAKKRLVEVAAERDAKEKARLAAEAASTFLKSALGRRDEAIKLREELLALRRKALGPEHPDTLESMTSLVGSYSEAGRPDEAIKLREGSLALRRKALGLEHPDTLKAMTSLAGSYSEAGRRDEAVKLWEEVLPLIRKVNGPEHPETLKVMIRLALSFSEASRPDEAIKLWEEVLPLIRKVNGPEHPDTLRAMSSLADSYGDAGRMGEALPLWAESSARLPKDTFLALKIAALYVWFGKDADHTATCRRMLELAAGTTDASTADRAAKAYCLRPSSDPQLLESALTLAQHAVDLGKDNPWYQMGLGMAEYRHGNFPAADQALSAAEKTAGKDNRWVQGTARLFHAMSLFRQGKEAEARQLIAEAEAQLKPLPGDENQPLANGAFHDDVIVWLAYKEVKVLLPAKAQTVPPKPGGK